jgi:ribosomal protein S18 acetylase RimI-like enzyme
MHDDAFLRAFEECTLPAAGWNHRAHVRVAYLYASRHGLADAIERMRASIQRYNAASQTPDTLDRGYHETITLAFMRLIFAANLHTGPHADSRAFCERHPELLDKQALSRFYSRDRIKTWDAKQSFAFPDRCPLPTVIDDRFTILQVVDGESLQAARELFLEYAQSLDFSLCFQQFGTELRELPGSYALPAGRLLLAYHRPEPAGCVALRPLRENLCEMKRLWVRPHFRQTGLGRSLALAVIDEARRCGYAGIRLDTVPSMKSAITLYHSLGFRETSPYTPNPVPGAIFMQLDFSN